MTDGNTIRPTLAVPTKAIAGPSTLLDAGRASLNNDLHIFGLVAKVTRLLRIDHLRPEG